MKRDLAKLTKQVADWNARVKVGDEVEYRGHPGTKPQVLKTQTAASVLSGHTAVVWLDGKSGCVGLDWCRPVANEGK